MLSTKFRVNWPRDADEVGFKSKLLTSHDGWRTTDDARRTLTHYNSPHFRAQVSEQKVDATVNNFVLHKDLLSILKDHHGHNRNHFLLFLRYPWY